MSYARGWPFWLLGSKLMEESKHFILVWISSTQYAAICFRIELFSCYLNRTLLWIKIINVKPLVIYKLYSIFNRLDLDRPLEYKAKRSYFLMIKKGWLPSGKRDTERDSWVVYQISCTTRQPPLIHLKCCSLNVRMMLLMIQHQHYRILSCFSGRGNYLSLIHPHPLGSDSLAIYCQQDKITGQVMVRVS